MSEYEYFKKHGIVSTKEESMKVYLAGPIFEMTDAEANDWRDYVTEKLNCQTLNPMARDYRGSEMDNAKAIVEDDKLDIMMSDIVLVYYGPHKPGSMGTAMEILFAWEQNKEVFVVLDADKFSPWLAYHASWIAKDLDES